MWWPHLRIAKVGYTDESRWRIFEPRGAMVLALRQFDTAANALAFEARCHEVLEAAGEQAFASKAEARASEILGSQGCGYLECFTLPEGWTAEDVLDVCGLSGVRQ